jgi:hypothetical protein
MILPVDPRVAGSPGGMAAECSLLLCGDGCGWNCFARVSYKRIIVILALYNLVALLLT